MKRVLVLLSALLLLACGKEEVAQEEVRPVRTMTVGEGGDAGAVALSGEIRARHEVAQSFRIGGKLVERMVEVGSKVKQGQILARLDAGDVALNVAAVRAQVDTAKTELAQLALNLQRGRDLLAQKFVSQAEVDNRQTAFDAGQRKLEQAQAQLKLAENQSAYAVLHADGSGVVTATDAEAGQVLAAGQTVVRIARAGEMEVVVDVAESQSIKVGQPASVTLWAVPGRTFKGRVRELAPAADAVTRTYRSRIQLQDRDEAIRLGMSATVNLVPEAEKMTGVVLPLSAVYGADKSARVWVLDKDARARAREVRVLATTTRGLKVAGLAHGEIVVTAGAHLLQEGQKVRPMTTVESR